MTIGPVPSASALAYIDMCRKRLLAFEEDDAVATVMNPDVVGQFDALLDDWEQAALGNDPFVWSTDIDAERAEHLFHAFYQLVSRSYDLFDEASERAWRPRAAFRIALTNAVLDALESEGKGSSELARSLRESWPDDDIG